MNIWHDAILSLEIFGTAVGALVLASFVVAQLRHFLDRDDAPFNYPADVPVAEAQAAAEGYLHRSLVALDIFMNVVFMHGYQGETMSTHAWRAALDGKLWGHLMNFWLNGFQPRHGPQAASGDLERSQAEVDRMRKFASGYSPSSMCTRFFRCHPAVFFRTQP
jgi:hypothetical protein